MKQTVLVTGGAGYIGSHTVVKLLEEGCFVVVLDNFSNSDRSALERISKLTGKEFEFVEADIRDRLALKMIFQRHSIDAALHFAALKAVGTSEAEPLEYYDANVSGSVTLFEEMARARVETIVFSSSAAVYGEPEGGRCREDAPLAPINVYGRTKLMVETILRDIERARPSWRIASLRYFNAAGAHASGLIGEDPTGAPSNLMPYIAQVAIGKRSKLSVFGNEYPTPDGTGRRDYIHVEDLAAGHVAALRRLTDGADSLITVNLGTGRSHSVLELVRAFEKASGRSVPFEIAPRRAGDLAELYADPTLAEKILGWEAKLGIDKICEDTWRWQLNHAGRAPIERCSRRSD